MAAYTGVWTMFTARACPHEGGGWDCLRTTGHCLWPVCQGSEVCVAPKGWRRRRGRRWGLGWNGWIHRGPVCVGRRVAWRGRPRDGRRVSVWPACERSLLHCGSSAAGSGCGRWHVCVYESVCMCCLSMSVCVCAEPHPCRVPCAVCLRYIAVCILRGQINPFH